MGRGESGGGVRNKEQTALPAWLESLRAGDRPAVTPKSFSQEDMREEGMVPSWMQPNRGQEERVSNSFPSVRPAASPAPNTDESYLQQRNISANSLIDANALPSWMQPENPQTPPQNISASSLVQPEFMPDWMKTMQPSGQPQQAPAQQPPLPAQGFSAQQLIDPQSLPSWMQPDGGQNVSSPSPSIQTPSSNLPGSGSTGQQGFAASSLLDMNALPTWMREGEQAPQEQRGSVQSQQQPQAFQYQYEQPQAFQYQYEQPQRSQPPVPPTGQSQGGTLSMGSLIDVNSLPEWLRASSDMPQSQPGQIDANRYSGPNASPNYAFPPRQENMRVPSRPRNEAGVNEDSEVAANVFSSMLGVASNAPQYPLQPQQPQQGNYAMPGGQAMGNMAPPQQGNYTMPGGQAMGNMVPPQQGMQYPQAYNPQGYAPQMPVQQNYGYPQQGQGGYLQQNMSQVPQQNERPAKKAGLFEAIRNFFFPSKKTEG